jgi:two-component system sensor histidine kinase KdpD
LFDMTLSFDRRGRRLRPLVAGAGVWLVAWLAMIVLDGHVDLGNQALLLVLGAALAALWLPATVAMIACAAAVMAFNYAFVPPRGEFAVDLEQHALLLGTMLAVSWLVSLLVERQRRLAANERRHRLRAEQLRALGEALRDAEDPRTSGALLQRALAQLVGGSVAVLLLEEPPTDAMSAADAPLLGPASADERVALWLCMRAGAVTGGPVADDDPHAWYLPIRGRRANFGAALLRLAQALDTLEAATGGSTKG